MPPGKDANWILDVCTGTGDLALAYCRARRPEARIVGSDFCRPMLAIAREKCRRAGAAGQIALVEADALQLPFPDGRVPDRLRGLRAAERQRHGRRVAGDGPRLPARRAGGGAGVLHAPAPAAGAVYDWYFRRVLPRVGQTLARNRQAAYNYLPASVGQFPQGEALAERMRAAGLDESAAARSPWEFARCTSVEKPAPSDLRGDAS